MIIITLRRTSKLEHVHWVSDRSYDLQGSLNILSLDRSQLTYQLLNWGSPVTPDLSITTLWLLVGFVDFNLLDFLFDLQKCENLRPTATKTSVFYPCSRASHSCQQSRPEATRPKTAGSHTPKDGRKPHAQRKQPARPFWVQPWLVLLHLLHDIRPSKETSNHPASQPTNQTTKQPNTQTNNQKTQPYIHIYIHIYIYIYICTRRKRSGRFPEVGSLVAGLEARQNRWAPPGDPQLSPKGLNHSPGPQKVFKRNIPLAS